MKRTFAVVIVAVTAGTSIALAAPVRASSAGSAPAAASVLAASVLAASAKAKPQVMPDATLRVVPSWTYRDGGKLAVIATCSERTDQRFITSRMLRHPVRLPKRGNLLIKLTSKLNTGKYAIALWCVDKQHQVDAMAVKSVKILKRFGSYKMPSPPRLPKHFKPAVTVVAGPPAPVKAPLGKKKAD
jgi:hypothetical protein